MTITLDLSPEKEARLCELAAARGQEPREFAQDVIDRELGTSVSERQIGSGQSFYDRVKDHIGIIDDPAGPHARDVKRVYGEIVTAKHDRRRQ
jgi:hypothetical protein